MTAHAIVAPTHKREDGRGLFLELLNGGSWGAVSYGRMRSGAVMGNHYHKRTEVFFFLLTGRASVSTIHAVTAKRNSFSLSARTGVRLVPNEAHAIRFEEESEFVMAKSLPYDPDDPDTFPLAVEP